MNHGERQGISVKQLAEELCISANAIIAKCRAEGLEASAQTPRSVLKLGLAETIRKWLQTDPAWSMPTDTGHFSDDDQPTLDELMASYNWHRFKTPSRDRPGKRCVFCGHAILVGQRHYWKSGLRPNSATLFKQIYCCKACARNVVREE